VAPALADPIWRVLDVEGSAHLWLFIQRLLSTSGQPVEYLEPVLHRMPIRSPDPGIPARDDGDRMASSIITQWTLTDDDCLPLFGPLSVSAAVLSRRDLKARGMARGEPDRERTMSCLARAGSTGVARLGSTGTSRPNQTIAIN